MSASLHTENAPLDEEDKRLLRLAGRFKGLAAGMNVLMLGLLLALIIACVMGLVDSGIRRQAGVVLAGMLIATLALLVSCARYLLRLPRSWRRVNLALRGRVAKQIVSGVTTSFGVAERPGVSYGFGAERVDVAVPRWNDVVADTGRGARPALAAGLIGVPVRLHLLTLLPERPPLLLRAEYPCSAAATLAIEAVSDADRQEVRQEELWLRKLFNWAALAMLGASVFVGPLILAVPVLFVLGLILGAPSRRLKRAVYKHGVRGVVEESLVYRLRHGTSTPLIVHNYRIGGVLYETSYGGDPVPPGQRVAFEFLDMGKAGLHPLFFRVEGEAGGDSAYGREKPAFYTASGEVAPSGDGKCGGLR